MVLCRSVYQSGAIDGGIMEGETYNEMYLLSFFAKNNYTHLST